jgi:N-acetylmuramoyl-L-alanine amidase
LGVLVVLFSFVSAAFASGSPAARKQQARTQYETAEQMREALNGRPESDRTRKDYLRVADAYRKVYYRAPFSSKADASVVAVAEILAEMGRQFAPDDKDLLAAIGEYEFLRREYPGSKYRVEALFTIAQIYKEDLGDEAAARSHFEEFLKRYPHSQQAAKAQEALAELDHPNSRKKTEPVAKNDAPTDLPTPSTVGKKAGPARVTGIRYWSTADYTRVAIDVDSEVKYEAGRVPDPDRIFFDLPDTRLVSTLLGKSFDVQDGFLKKIRVAQYQRAATRVVLEVDDVTEYSAFLLPNPYRLIIDIHGKATRSTAQVQDNLPPPASAAENQGGSEAKQAVSSNSASKSDARTVAGGSAGSLKPELKDSAITPKVSANEGKATPKDVSTTTSAFKNGNGELTQPKRGQKPSAPQTAKSDSKAEMQSDELMAKATTKPTTAPTAVTVVPEPEKKTEKPAITVAKKPAKTTSADIQPVHAATPTSDGDRSLIRALGLKIGRIVIDAGHGGHDTGTIGPNGLQEKDLVLDVALRLGKLLESKLGAEVIYTRDDDTFIPLETRTAIANEKQADLFVSVHANSSQDSSARGVETYYLNFTTNADALEVAARENAVSEKSIYQLQDLVKKITLKDKIEESRELAGDVQASLYAGLSPKNATLKNRGVKKAPFVVLIGANMPSILAEISFVSNPSDEKKLETPEYRQKIAESLYRGIYKYVSGLSGVKVAAKMPVSSGQ